MLVPHDAAAEPFLEAKEALAVGLQEPIFWQARHPGDGAGDVVACDRCPGLAACARARQVDRRERLVRQAPVANVPRGELRGRVQRLGKEPHAMMLLVLRGRSAEDPRRVRRRRLAHQHRNEAPLQRRIRLDVLLELVVRGGADAGKLAARERRLQLIGRILRSLAGGSGADQHVKLVDEDDEAAVGALHLVLDPDQAFAERAAQLRSGHQATHVELEENAVAAEHAQREAFDDGGLANPGLADEHRIVRPALAEDVEELLGLALAAHCGIELSFDRQGGEVARMGGEERLFARVQRPWRRRARGSRFGRGFAFRAPVDFRGRGQGSDGDLRSGRLRGLPGHHRGLGRLRGGDGDVPAPRDRARQIAERGGPQGGRRPGGAFQQ